MKLDKQIFSDCDFSIELLSAYIDNELNEIERQKVEEHLKHCPHCPKVIEEFKTIDNVLKEVEIEEPSREFALNLKKRVMGKIRKKRTPVLRKLFPVLVPIVAVAILVIIITTQENLTYSVGMKDRIDIVLVSPEKSLQTDKIDVIIPQPTIAAKTEKPAPEASHKAIERKTSTGRDAGLAYKEAEGLTTITEEIASKKVEPFIVRAIIDSTGRVLNVATGKSITPQEDTTVSRMLINQQLAPPTVRGRPKQMVVEFVANKIHEAVSPETIIK